MNFGWYRMLLFNESFIKLCVKALYFFFFSVLTFKLPIEIKCIFWQIQCPWIFWRKQVNWIHSCYRTKIFNTRAFQYALVLWFSFWKKFIEHSGQPSGRESVFLNRELCTNEWMQSQTCIIRHGLGRIFCVGYINSMPDYKWSRTAKLRY